ncbi:MAG: hypothetical protein QF748_00090 [Candidatus Pacebacteria bacterium]|nr:hypothetical protein [Candidatus Paceibacterota bacterium]
MEKLSSGAGPKKERDKETDIHDPRKWKGETKLREDTWSHIEKEDRKIVPLLRALHGVGIPTISCCEGHRRLKSRPYPWVLIDSRIIDQNKLHRLRELLRSNLYNGVKWELTETHIPYEDTEESGLPETNFVPLKMLQPEQGREGWTEETLERDQESINQLAEALSSIET